MPEYIVGALDRCHRGVCLAVVVWLGCCVVYRLYAIVRLVGGTASLYHVVEAGRYCGSAAASGSKKRMAIQVDGLISGCALRA